MMQRTRLASAAPGSGRTGAGTDANTTLKTAVLTGLCALAALAAAASNARADPASGTFGLTIWSAATPSSDINSNNQQATRSNPLVSTTDPVYVGSYTGAINFAQQTGTDSIGTFLATAGGTLTLNSAIHPGAGLATTLSSGGFQNVSLFDFTFTSTSAAVYTVSHDDGFSIWDATNTTEVISGFEGSTVDVDSTFTLAAGTYNLWYAEANGLPADLTMNVPEPASVALLGVGMIGAGMMARRRRSSAMETVAG